MDQYKYDVIGSEGGSQITLFSSLVYQESLQFFMNHAEAIGILKFKKVTDNHWWSNGLLQPGIPSTKTINGVKYERAYVGPHSLELMTAFKNSFEKDGYPTATLHNKRGYYIYVGDKQ